VRDLSKEQWERAHCAFYPFVEAFNLSLNPEDIDEIIIAILTHVDSDASPEAIVDEVRAQIANYLESARLMHAAQAAHHAESQVSSAAAPGWVVWRQDDHGNRAEVARHDERADADAHVTELEGRGHKQTYWVARTEA
jgi:hypothetical protein